MARATTPPIAASGVVVKREGVAGGDRGEHRRPGPSALQRRGDAERAERVGDEPVVAGAVAVAR